MFRIAKTILRTDFVNRNDFMGKLAKKIERLINKTPPIFKAV